MKKTINKILIANRGEIAVRIIRTCKKMGIKAVSVYSKADSNSRHVQLADESVCIGESAASESYLNYQSIITAAKSLDVDAIHPGYGFLSENYDFALACEKNNIIFLGPKTNVLSLLFSKTKSKELAYNSGIKTLTATLLDTNDLESVRKTIEEIGLPVIIKSEFGGGGKGIERIYDFENIEGKILKLEKEVKSFFGRDELFVEKYLENAKHIEIQIMADEYGNVFHLGERDCSLQRNYQKVIEETPASNIPSDIKESIFKDAVNLMKSVGYSSAGTVEFLYDQDSQNYYFMEINPRIQVEHPVTEMLTDIDIVEKQIEVARGNKLAINLGNKLERGHSIECRILAENPKTKTPSPGKITTYIRPEGRYVRMDDFIYDGIIINPFYDSMIAKLIVKANNREEAIEKMIECLYETRIEGIDTNINSLISLLNHSLFTSGKYTTKSYDLMI